MDAALQYAQQGGNLSNINISPQLLQQLQQAQQNAPQYGADNTAQYGAAASGGGYGASNPGQQQQASTAGVAPQSAQQLSTCFCPYCNTHLSYPSQSTLI